MPVLKYLVDTNTVSDYFRRSRHGAVSCAGQQFVPYQM